MKGILLTIGLILSGTGTAGGWSVADCGEGGEPVMPHRLVKPANAKGDFYSDDGAISYRGRYEVGKVVFDEPLAEGDVVTFRFRLDRFGYPPPVLRWGTEEELHLGLSPTKPTWSYSPRMRPDGKGRTWDRAQRGDFQPRVQVQRAFWWPTDVADIMDRYNGLPAVWEFPEDVYAISLEFRGGAVLVRQQGALSGSFRPAKPIAAPTPFTPSFTISAALLAVSPYSTRRIHGYASKNGRVWLMAI